jgi:predicted ATPase
MIKSIEIKNFKSIKSKYFPLRNLNVLLGLNGMGKSSFIQCLLGLRQSQKRAYGEFGLNGDYVNIGTTKDALYQYAKGENFSTNVKFSENKELDFKFDYKINADKFTANNIESNIYGEKFNKIYDNIVKDESLYNDSFQYLKANRHDPQTINPKNPTLVVEKRNIGNKGEHAAHYIESFSNENVVIDSLLHKDSKTVDEVTGDELVVRTLKKQLDLWMGEISPGVHVQTTEVSSEDVKLEYTYKQPNLGSTNTFKPENVGFGITYGLPVVLSLLKAKPGDLIIIENPESHIHPRGQAELGRMVALAAMGGVQIVVETHSDHIINGIRVAVKEEKIKQDEALIFYFDKVVEREEQYSEISEIEIGKNGALSKYPENLLDEWSNQLSKLI